MLIVVSMLLLAVGLSLLGLNVLLLWLKVWLLALMRLLEGKFIKAGWWLCVALVPFNLFSEGESYVPLYVRLWLRQSRQMFGSMHAESICCT
jgi:hypothetical protein